MSIKGLKKLIKAIFINVKGHPICKLPAVITKPGRYFLNSDLVFHGSGTAITIKSSNVFLDFDYHTLALTFAGSDVDHPNIGVLVDGPLIGDILSYSNIVLKNLSITTLVLSPNFSDAVQINGAKHVTIESSTLKNTSHGVLTQNVDGVHITNTHFINNYGVRQFGNDINTRSFGANVFHGEDTKNLTIEKSVFTGQALGDLENVSFGTLGDELSQRVANITIRDSQFVHSESSIHPRQCDNLLIENCQFQQTNTLYSVIQFGNFLRSGTPNIRNVIIRNVNITALDSKNGANIIALVAGDGALFQNVNVKSNSDSNSPAAILIGSGEFAFNNVVFDNLILTGPNFTGLNIFGSQNVTIKNSHLNEAFIQILAQDAYNVTIKDSDIQGSIGIQFIITTDSVIENNVIRKNNLIGLFLAQGANNNIVANNKLIRNGAAILDTGDNNELVGNIIIENESPCSPIEGLLRSNPSRSLDFRQQAKWK